MKNYEGKKVVCVNENGLVMKVGDKVTCSRGSEYTIRSFEPPHKPSANGRIYTNEGRGYYASVFKCKYKPIEEVVK